MLKTLSPGKLIVMTAYPDPPFDIKEKGGFDGDLINAICDNLQLDLQQETYEGDNFNDIFDCLNNDICDAVISGTTITPSRAECVLFSNPYLEFNQGIAVNTELTRHVKSFQDLKGLVAGIQRGNTSEQVAKQLLSDNIITDIKYYAYKEIYRALDDLDKGKIGLVIKLVPVISYLVKEFPRLAVVLQAPTNEKLAIAFAKTNSILCSEVNRALVELKQNGTMDMLKNKWVKSYLDLPLE